MDQIGLTPLHTTNQSAWSAQKTTPWTVPVNNEHHYQSDLVIVTRFCSRLYGRFAQSLRLKLDIKLHIHCVPKSGAKIQITITTAYLIRIKYSLSSFNYHLSDVNVANFNKIHYAVSEQQLF